MESRVILRLFAMYSKLSYATKIDQDTHIKGFRNQYCMSRKRLDGKIESPQRNKKESKINLCTTNFQLWLVKGTVSRNFLPGVFSWIIFPQAPEKSIKSFQIFSKIYGGKWRWTTSINDTGDNFPPVSTKLEANFATGTAGVVDTSGKFATGVVDTGGNLPPVSTTPMANNGNDIRRLTS